MKDLTRIVLVTGHVFGIRAFEGIFASQQYLDGRIDVPLMVGLDSGYSSSTVGYHPISHLASEQNIRHVNTTDGRLIALEETIRNLSPNYILVIGWSRLVSPTVLRIPDETYSGTGTYGAFGCIGMHPTKLPSGRGQAPIPWTIIKGLDNTALSVFFLEEKADTGSIIAQYSLDVRSGETAASLFYRMASLHFKAGFDLAEGLAERAIVSRSQDQSAATVWPKRRPADGEILSSMTRAQIGALVRALLGPYHRAFVYVDGQRYNVKGCEVADTRQTNRIRFKCADGVIHLVVEVPENS
jgi:methionyl-tRNA formyltransferase